MADRIELAGEVVRLEPLGLQHVEPLARLASAEREAFRWSVVPFDLTSTQAYVALALAEAGKGLSVPFATVLRSSGAVVGSTRFMAFERWPQAFAPPPGLEAPIDAVEIGSTWLGAQARRSAVNTEAKRLMLAHAFETWAVRRVTLKTDARNEASRRAIERLGARLDGVLRSHARASDGGPRDSAWYSILASEWPAVRGRLDGFLQGLAAPTRPGGAARRR